MLLLELNEFNPALFVEYSKKEQLNNIRRMLELPHTSTVTQDKEERYGLDPWVQWVSIHTGVPSGEHGIKHLADIDQLSAKLPQIWEQLAKDYQIPYTVWGAMNSSMRSEDFCEAFFPDPWTYTEKPYPDKLNKLMAFPRFYAKNYLNLLQTEALKGLVKTLIFFLAPDNIPITGRLTLEALKGLRKVGINTNYLFTLFDYINAELFFKYAKNSDFKLLFLNSVAHLQHHYWTDANDNPNIQYCLKNIDYIIGKAFKLFPNEPIVIVNAFQQQKSYYKNEYLYRQKDPTGFLKQLGLSFIRTEQLMTNDSHILFASRDDQKKAAKCLRSFSINDKPAFHVEDEADPLKIFFQFRLWEDFDTETTLIGNRHTFRLYDYFEKVVRRTGTHINKGDIYSTGISLPRSMENHELKSHIINYYRNTYDSSHPSLI